jgi:hypothetical protein
MYQSTAKKTVPLVSLAYRRRIKNKVLHDLLVIESANRNKDSNDNNNDCN